MNKKQHLFRFFGNLLMYTVIFIGAYFLYSIHNTSTHNVPHTDFSFVYAQF